MGQSSVDLNRSAFSNASANSEFNRAQTCNHHRQLISIAVIQIVIRKLIYTFRRQTWQRCDLGAILAGLVMIFMPTHALAAQVTLGWDANNPAPDGYLVFQRIAGQAYDYAHPVWPTDGGNHTETTCTITNLTDGVTYFYVVRAYVGSDQSGDSNAVGFSSITDNNRPPEAEAGPNITITQGDNVVLSGSGSSDPDGDSLIHHWVQKSGPSATLYGTNSAQCSFTAPDPNAASATLVFELTVTDSKGLFAGDTCVVLVNAAQQSPDNDGDGIPDDLDSDDDNDGMPDDWEVRYNLEPFKNDAAQDADNDGISNLEEYQAGSDPNQNDGNHPPEQPTLTNPVQGEAGVALSPWLNASDFIDPDSNDQHAQTQWRIALSSGSQQIVLDRTCITKHLTEMHTPRLVLDPSTEYTVQVRFYDNDGEASPWSLPVTFTTEADPKDKNKNKIPDSQEVPADADMNGDAIPDLEQSTVVKSVTTYKHKHIMSVSVESNDAGAEVQAALSVDPITLVSTDYSTPYPEVETPYGLLGYKIKVDHPGDSIRATVHLSDPIDPQQTHWVRYDEIRGMQDCSTATTMDESGLMVERNLVDGGDEDADGAANGVIVDLSGPRVLSATNDSSLAITTDGRAASGGNSGSCFIQSLF